LPSRVRAGVGERREKGQAIFGLRPWPRLRPSERKERERESSWAAAARWAGSGLVGRESGRRNWAASVGWIRPRQRGKEGFLFFYFLKSN
jgi:hypothetical protein